MIRAHKGHVVVRESAVEQTTTSGLIMAGTGSDVRRGKVISSGVEDINEGMIVLFPKESPTLNDLGYIILLERVIVATEGE